MPQPSEVQTRFQAVVDKLEASDTSLAASVADNPTIEFAGRPPTIQDRYENPRVPDQTHDDYVWLEWDEFLDDQPPSLDQFHHVGDNACQFAAATPCVVTRRARSLSLGATPCPTCFDMDSRNDDLD